MAMDAEPPHLSAAESTDDQATDVPKAPALSSIKDIDDGGVDSKDEAMNVEETNQETPGFDIMHGSSESIANGNKKELNGDKDNRESSRLETFETNVSLQSTTENAIDFTQSISWSVHLQSPTVVAFSPSLDPNRPGSLHGLGKQYKNRTLYFSFQPLSTILMLILFVVFRFETSHAKIQVQWAVLPGGGELFERHCHYLRSVRYQSCQDCTSSPSGTNAV
jgi:hypothetical protein